jgi:hypothetical protein
MEELIVGDHRRQSDGKKVEQDQGVEWPHEVVAI